MEPSTTKQDVAELKENLKKVKAFMAEVEKVGGRMPLLKKALDRLELAIDTGMDIADALEEMRRSLEGYSNDLLSACRGLDAAEGAVCEYTVDWKLRPVMAIDWLLNVDKEDGAFRLTVGNILRRHLPAWLCKKFSHCRGDSK